MLIAIEDGNFYKHYGFEWKMVKEAYQRNKKAGRIRLELARLAINLPELFF